MSKKKKNKVITKYPYGFSVQDTKYEYLGRKNETEFPEFIEICKMSQKKLKVFLEKKLRDNGYKNIIYGDGFLFVKGDIPVLLTAHMDTVHKEPIEDFYEYVDKNGNHILSSPQGIGGDDRCGIYMILDIIKERKCSVLFCEDEEIGGIGSDKFCKTEHVKELSDLKFMIELDRRGSNDAVYYDCDNYDFEEFVTESINYKTAWGSFSDISNLAPVIGIAAVNLSCGYHNEHTLQEEVNVEEMLASIGAAKILIDASEECNPFDYIPYKYSLNKYYNKYDDWDEWYDGYYTGKSLYDNKADEVGLEIMWQRKVGDEEIYETETEVYYGINSADCLGQFFMDHPDFCFNDILDYFFL